MKSIISVLAMISVFSLAATAAQDPSADHVKVFCGIVRWPDRPPTDNNPTKWLFSKEVDFVRNENLPYGTELYRGQGRSYFLDIGQAILILTVTKTKTDEVLGSATSMWPTQLSKATRVELEIPDAMPNHSVQFYCGPSQKD